jgi:hypothetical protein
MASSAMSREVERGAVISDKPRKKHWWDTLKQPKTLVRHIDSNFHLWQRSRKRKITKDNGNRKRGWTRKGATRGNKRFIAFLKRSVWHDVSALTSSNSFEKYSFCISSLQK